MPDHDSVRAGQELLLERIHAMLAAESLEAILSEGAAALAAATGGTCAAAFLIEADRVLAEGWSPAAPDAGSPAGPMLRSLALESVRHVRPVVLPGEAGGAPPRAALLSAGGRTLGAACVLPPAGAAEPVPAQTLERAAALVAEAIDSRRRRESERTVARQQERWFNQLDRQVRVLDRERQKFAAVTNQGDTYVFVTDPAGTIRWVNRAMNERWPPPDREGGWVGRSCHEVCSMFGPESPLASCRTCPVTRAVESNAAVHHELREVAENRVSTLYLSALPIKGLDGRAQEALVMIQDLTDLETLRDSEERYRVVTQGASDGIVTVDESGRIVFANEAAGRIFGWEPRELLGQPLTRLMDPQQAARHHIAFSRYLHTGERTIPWSGIRLPGRDRSGREILLEMTFGESMRDGRRLVTGVMRDVTERIRAERELQEAQARLRMVVSHSPIVLFAIDGDGRFTLSEGRGLATLGLAPGEVVGRSAFELYANAPRIADNLRRALDGEELTDEVEVDGLVFETRLTPLRDEGGAVQRVIGLATDVTERRRLEAQLGQAQKMEAVGRLAGGVAHDFNNLLTTILGYCAMLLRQPTPSGADLERRLLEIQRAAERGAGLTRQLLAFSRRQVVEPHVLDLDRLIGEMAGMLSRLIGEDIDLVVVPAPEGAAVHADRGQLEQVLMNLVVNAREAMPQGGRVTIEVSHADLERPEVRGQVTVPAGSWAVLAVRDTGIGMDRETLNRIFEPFFTRKERGRGSGLGLAMVYGIVEQAGGCIVVESETGVGSSFMVYLPRATERTSAEVPPLRTPASGGRETVLLVEDEAPLRALAREMLSGAGYRVIAAASGAQALQAAAAHDGPVHLMVTDVVMPGMSGGELAVRMREARPDTHVLFMSGYADDEIVRHGVVRSESPLLAKPFTESEFLARVRAILDRPPDARTGEARSAA